MVRVSLIEQVTFEQRFERGEAVSSVDIWGKGDPSRKNMLGVSQNSKEAGMEREWGIEQ